MGMDRTGREQERDEERKHVFDDDDDQNALIDESDLSIISLFQPLIFACGPQ